MNHEDANVQYWADKASALARENLDLRNKNEELERRVVVKDGVIERNRKTIDSMQSSIDYWKRGYYDQTKIAQTELTRSQNLMLELLDFKEALALNIKQVQKLGSQLGKVSRRLHKKRAQYRELTQELPEAVAKINSMAFDLGIAETNLKSNRETIENLKMVADGWKRQFDEKEKELEKLKHGVEDAKNFIQLEKSYDDLHDRHQDALKQIRPLEEENEALESRIEECKKYAEYVELQHSQLSDAYAEFRVEHIGRIKELESTVIVLSRLLGKE